MKIIQILNSPNWSGASSYCIQLCECLKKRGHEILLLTEPGRPLDRARKAGIPFDSSIRLNHRNPSLYLHAMKRMARIFSAFNPDIISSHINEGAWMAGMVARHVTPRTAVVRTRGDIDPPKGHFINRFVHHAWTDHLIVSSLLHKRICQQILEFPAGKIDVVYGAIDPEGYAPRADSSEILRHELGVGPDTLLIGMVARLDPVKGHEYALQALRLLGKCPVKRRFLFFGYENERTFPWLKKIAGEMGVLDQISCFGYRPDLPEILAGCDIGLISSVGSEANCRAALEFMASGKPLVATRVGVIPEIVIEEEQGFIINPRDPLGMATALSRLMTNAPLRATMGGKGRDLVLRNFNLDLFAKRTEKVYLKAVAGKTG